MSNFSRTKPQGCKHNSLLGIGPAALILLTFSCIGRSFGADQTVEAANRAWLARETSVKSLAAAWEVGEVRPAGSVVHFSPPSEGAVITATQLPPIDALLRSQIKMLLEGDSHFRFERRGPQIPYYSDDFLETFELRVSDGTACKTYKAPLNSSDSEGGGQLGFAYEPREFKVAESTALLPIMVLFRPRYAPFKGCYDVSHFNNVGDGRIGETDCKKLEWTSADVKSRTQLYVDSAHDYLPLRVEQSTKRTPMANGDWRLFLRIEYEYRKNPDDFLQVAGWEISAFKTDNSLLTQTRARITELTLNAPVSDADFRFEFPVGTRISVTKGGQFERSYILLKDGQERPLTSAKTGR